MSHVVIDRVDHETQVSELKRLLAEAKGAAHNHEQNWYSSNRALRVAWEQRDKAEAERDAYRAALCDMVKYSKGFGPVERRYFADARAKAIDLLKNGPTQPEGDE